MIILIAKWNNEVAGTVRLRLIDDNDGVPEGQRVIQLIGDWDGVDKSKGNSQDDNTIYQKTSGEWRFHFFGTGMRQFQKWRSEEISHTGNSDENKAFIELKDKYFPK